MIGKLAQATLAVLLLTGAQASPEGSESMTRVAKGTFDVSLKPLEFEGVEPQHKVGRMSIDKKFEGALTASSVGQMLSAMTATEGSAGYVAIELVTGTLDGKQGSFVLQHSGTMRRGAPALAVSVVPDSATGELVGLEGEMAIEMADGKHAYELTYRLPTP